MSNSEKSQKVIEVFMQMTKFEIQKLINANNKKTIKTLKCDLCEALGENL